MTTIATDKPGAALAEQLLKQSEADAASTPMDAVLDAARAGRFTDDQCFRLLARLWTLKRMMYYVYGGWAQGINLNEYPPAVAYLFGKQTYDESTQEMQLCDEMLRRRWVRTQKRLFAHPYAQFGTATRTGSYIFCLRALANYPQNIRIAAHNLGPKGHRARVDREVRQVISATKPCTRYFKASSPRPAAMCSWAVFKWNDSSPRKSTPNWPGAYAPKPGATICSFSKRPRVSSWV